MKAVLLCAGKGTRIKSEDADLPKCLFPVYGKPMVRHVLDALDFLPPEDIIIVVGFLKDQVMETLGGGYRYAIQEPRKGTAHAVMSAEPLLSDYEGDVLLQYGDMPLVSRETYLGMIGAQRGSGAKLTVLAATSEEVPDYGRLVRDQAGRLMDVIDYTDCTPEQLAIREVNVGANVADCRTLFSALHKIDNNNSKGEYYLQHLPRVFYRENLPIEVCAVVNHDEIFGVNSREDLARCERILKAREDKNEGIR